MTITYEAYKNQTNPDDVRDRENPQYRHSSVMTLRKAEFMSQVLEGCESRCHVRLWTSRNVSLFSLKMEVGRKVLKIREDRGWAFGSVA